MVGTKAGEGSASVIRALNSGLRRELMKIGWERPMDRNGFYDALLSRGFDVDYPEFVYADLNKLVRAGLMEKYYNTRQKCIVYRSKVDKVVIDFNNIKVDLEVYEKKANPEEPSPEVALVFRALDTDFRRALIKLLSERPVGTNEAFDSLCNHPHAPSSPNAVYRNLEMLVNSGIAEKSYDKNRKMMTYRMKKGKLMLSVNYMKTGLLANVPTDSYKVLGGVRDVGKRL